MDFANFIKSHPTCSVVSGSKTAQFIYENIIWEEKNRIKMAEFSDNGICALAAVVSDIEACAASTGSDLNIYDDTVKKVVGRIIAESLEPLGYFPERKTRIPQRYFVGAFKNASVYKFDESKAVEKIVKHIEKV